MAVAMVEEGKEYRVRSWKSDSENGIEPLYRILKSKVRTREDVRIDAAELETQS